MAVRRRNAIAALCLGALLACGGFWAGRVTVAPPVMPTEMVASKVTAEVTQQTVGQELSLNVTVEQEKRPLAVNSLAGVVTEVRTSGDPVQPGDVLYRVANVPVRIVVGALPFYRPLAPGDQGEDVRQLQGALIHLKLLTVANGKFGDSTTRAVKAWQKALDMPQSGTVALGELVAAVELPAQVVLDPDVVAPGVAVAGGERAVLGAVGDPVFGLPLSEAQARLIPESATISVPFDGRIWQAVVAAAESSENGGIRYRLSAPDGGPVCGADCAAVTGEKVSILSKVAVVPPASGPAVPVGAITTRADGSAFVNVVDAAGGLSERTVTVRGSQGGVAVVEGVTVGETVQVLAAGR